MKTCIPLIIIVISSCTAWGQTEEAKLTASDGTEFDYFGSSVSVDGDTALISAHGDGVFFPDPFDYVGSAYVFTRIAGVWTEQAKLTASDAELGDHFGYSVAVSGDTAVIGAVRGDDDDDGVTNSGAVYMFTRTAGVWTEQAKLTASDAASSDWFGISVYPCRSAAIPS